jgi:general stress protein 26
MANAQTNTGEQAEQHFRKVLEGFDQAMLVTHGAAAGMHARPMMIADTDEDGSIWFITGADTSKVYELESDAAMVAVMQSAAKSLTVGGRGELRRDPAKLQAVWKESFRAWFKGKDDPNILLIRLKPVEAEYWDNSGLQGVKFMLKFAKAVVSGQPLAHGGVDDVDAHAKLRL